MWPFESRRLRPNEARTPRCSIFATGAASTKRREEEDPGDDQEQQGEREADREQDRDRDHGHVRQRPDQRSRGSAARRPRVSETAAATTPANRTSPSRAVIDCESPTARIPRASVSPTLVEVLRLDVMVDDVEQADRDEDDQPDQDQRAPVPPRGVDRALPYAAHAWPVCHGAAA